ncbi:hypothetical protein AB0C84_45600 [Actinomadura sp. NPDC048955]|uniref:hypothetical protein n=1 Tax=Actinomadura sp. NPDC048955 TaxID=3158228 RepID=UPI0033C2BECD
MAVTTFRAPPDSVLGIPARLLKHLRDIALSRSPYILNLGAGVQSSTLLAGAADGLFPRPDVAIFADTGWERRATYRHLDRLNRLVAREAGIPLVHVSVGNIRRDAVRLHGHYASMPLHIRTQHGRKGILKRQCTAHYKVQPIDKAVRAILGAPISANGRIGSAPAGRRAIQFIGFSADEQRRVLEGGPDHTTMEYPLIEKGLTRTDCAELLTNWGLGDTPRSACIGCPFHGNAAWRELRRDSPEEWADACKVDELLRHGHPAAGTPLRGTAYLHRSHVPLDEAPIDRLSAAEWKARQGRLDLGPGVDVDTELIAYLENPPGCSPYGCRTTEIPVAAAVEAGA